MSLPVLYVCGPYRAATPWKTLENIRAAQQVALDLWKLGAVAICPHANTALFDGEANDRIWLEGDMELLRRCDGIVVFGRWQLSQGALAEAEYALKTLNLPMFFYDAPDLSAAIRGFVNAHAVTT